jgi:hypothetical protein
MRFLLPFFLLFLVGCQNNSQNLSVNPQAKYFYPFSKEPKVYLYRDVARGLEEEFHRVYGIEDKEGKHIVVERYSSDGRILEAVNYNVDSLKVFDHMVVDRFRKKERALIYKNELFPFDLNRQSWFASKFKGIVDSTLILREVKRTFKIKKRISVVEEEKEALVFNELIRLTVINPFTNKEESNSAKSVTYFAEGVGLAEWHNPTKRVHFRLEQILSQEKWVKIIAR